MTTARLYRRQEAAQLLGIPDRVAQACMLPVAYYTGTHFRPAVRGPIEEITFWDGWGQVLRCAPTSNRTRRSLLRRQARNGSSYGCTQRYRPDRCG
jgi:hypothetical protein